MWKRLHASFLIPKFHHKEQRAAKVVHTVLLHNGESWNVWVRKKQFASLNKCIIYLFCFTTTLRQKDESNQYGMFFVVFSIILVFLWRKFWCVRFRIHCYVAAPFTLLVGSLDLLQFSLLFCDQRYLREREKSLLQLQSIILRPRV
jgi:hypothetical protein